MNITTKKTAIMKFPKLPHVPNAVILPEIRLVNTSYFPIFNPVSQVWKLLKHLIPNKSDQGKYPNTKIISNNPKISPKGHRSTFFFVFSFFSSFSFDSINKLSCFVK